MDRDELLARVDLPALLDSISGPANERRRWHCPDREHPDEHPSVTVQIGGDGIARWRCWSGGHRGTAIDAVIAAQGVDVGTAMRWLADHAGAMPPASTPTPPPAVLPPIGQPAGEVVRYVNQAEALLWTAAGRLHREWLAERGLHEAVLRVNRVGADPGRRLLPRPKGFPGGWPAVVYPALDPTGGIGYFQARYLEPPPGRSKYDNPAHRWAANPRLAWITPPRPTRPGVLVVCEGPADALVAAQAGFRAVGVLGASNPNRRIAATLAEHRHGAQLVVCFDGDDAGRAGAERLRTLLAEHRVPVTTVTPPDRLDLTGWAQHTAAWTEALDPTRSVEPAPTLGIGVVMPSLR